MWGVKAFDGTENILEHGTIAGWFYYALAGDENADGYAIPQSTHFTGSTYAGNQLPDKCVCMGGGTPNRIIFRLLDYAGAVPSIISYLAAQYAAGTPVIVQYKLATPTTESLTPVPLPTYPRSTTLSCNVPVTATVRVAG